MSHKSGIQMMKMAVGAPVHGRLSVIRATMSAERGRYVTYSEALEELLDQYEATSALLADVKASRQ